MKRICTICARSGSQGVKNKNTRMLLGKPLVAHSIVQAKQSGFFDIVAVSSDSDNILQIASEYKADILIRRPNELSTNEAAKLPAIKHCVLGAEESTGQEFDIVVDLDVTSPLRIIEDIKEVLRVLEVPESGNIITVMPARRSPYFNMVELSNNGVPILCKDLDRPILRRQDAPPVFDLNASIYGWKRDRLFSGNGLFNNDTKLYIMPEERSIDIDSENDFLLVEFLMQRAIYLKKGTEK